jgi:nitrite reductase (NADH) small subunit
MTRRHVVCTVDQLPPGARKIVDVAGRSIGVFNVNGAYYALRNRCPHQGAPLCEGTLKGTAPPSRPGEYLWAREGEILRCPWHGWEFDITTGRSVFDPHRLRVRQYEVTVEPADPDKAPAAAPAEASVETFRVSVEGASIVLHV